MIVMTYVIWDPAPNRIVGREENWTQRQAERFLADHRDEFTASARVAADVWPALSSDDE